MPYMMPMKVRKAKGEKQHEFKVQMPVSLKEKDLIEQRYGSMERMIDRANSQWAVDAARGARDKLPDAKAAQAYLDAYCDDGRRSVPTPVSISKEEAEALEFSEEQLASLRAKGINIPS